MLDRLTSFIGPRLESSDAPLAFLDAPLGNRLPNSLLTTRHPAEGLSGRIRDHHGASSLAVMVAATRRAAVSNHAEGNRGIPAVDLDRPPRSALKTGATGVGPASIPDNSAWPSVSRCFATPNGPRKECDPVGHSARAEGTPSPSSSWRVIPSDARIKYRVPAGGRGGTYDVGRSSACPKSRESRR